MARPILTIPEALGPDPSQSWLDVYGNAPLGSTEPTSRTPIDPETGLPVVVSLPGQEDYYLVLPDPSTRRTGVGAPEEYIPIVEGLPEDYQPGGSQTSVVEAELQTVSTGLSTGLGLEIVTTPGWVPGQTISPTGEIVPTPGWVPGSTIVPTGELPTNPWVIGEDVLIDTDPSVVTYYPTRYIGETMIATLLSMLI